jgi:hypothetical protein
MIDSHLTTRAYCSTLSMLCEQAARVLVGWLAFRVSEENWRDDDEPGDFGAI